MIRSGSAFGDLSEENQIVDTQQKGCGFLTGDKHSTMRPTTYSCSYWLEAKYLNKTSLSPLGMSAGREFL